MPRLRRSWKSFRNAGRVTITSITTLTHSPTRNAYNFADGCDVYRIDFDAKNEKCKVCGAAITCKEGTKLLRKVSKLSVDKLPEYLAHERAEVRETAKDRLDELCI
jgi:hypothetical protein